ncbi:hypothetical protein NDU88_002038 [Pleurodeles waltl]|uniref:Uncharacterized protein n=1 Tax=Pleurodeles waltl TaxID=8319 RepID=A0AAV7W1S7_PLEWA|nr:hypothetical protein NDU88_002038 [Pleurodeles waltl]
MLLVLARLVACPPPRARPAKVPQFAPWWGASPVSPPPTTSPGGGRGMGGELEKGGGGNPVPSSVAGHSPFRDQSRLHRVSPATFLGPCARQGLLEQGAQLTCSVCPEAGGPRPPPRILQPGPGPAACVPSPRSGPAPRRRGGRREGGREVHPPGVAGPSLQWATEAKGRSQRRGSPSSAPGSAVNPRRAGCSRASLPGCLHRRPRGPPPS